MEHAIRTLTRRPSCRVGRSVVALGIAVLVLSLVPSSEGTLAIPHALGATALSASAQNSDPADAFNQILHTYRTGRAEEAITELVGWPVDKLVSAAKSATPRLSPSDRMSAAILDAEVIRALLIADRVKDSLVVAVSALNLADKVGSAPFGEKLGDEPRRSWYYGMASLRVAYGPRSTASSLVDIGLKTFPDDPLLLTARGTISDRLYGRFDAFSANSSGRPEDLMQWDAKAITYYKRALAVRPDLAIAQLRLGLIYLELGREREARPWLESVAAGASTDSQQYVAHLLLGRIASDAHQLETADAEYRKAYSIGAGYQTACIALSRLEDVLERKERAAQIANDCLGLPGSDDPWRDYRAKDDPDVLPHLRAEARGQ